MVNANVLCAEEKEVGRRLEITGFVEANDNQKEEEAKTSFE